ncbi:MAG TPA: TIGR03435 family protein [Terriglobia bacterium]|jgi:hypothetical protein
MHHAFGYHLATGVSIGGACLVLGQAVSPGLAFEAVSIKPNVSGCSSSGTNTPQGRLIATNVTVKQLIMQACRMQDFQVISGPDWIDAERFDLFTT